MNRKNKASPEHANTKVDFSKVLGNEKLSQKDEERLSELFGKKTKNSLEKMKTSLDGRIGLEDLLKEVNSSGESISRTIFLAKLEELGVIIEKQHSTKNIVKILKQNLGLV